MAHTKCRATTATMPSSFWEASFVARLPTSTISARGVTYGIARLNATCDIPVVYGLLTTNDLQQAKDRSGGRLGNKGDECAVVAIKMAKF